MSKKFTKAQTFSSQKTKKQIRTKRICSHPNPLFEKWLKEWKLEAENRGSNMKYNYQKAIKSLQKYPLPLHSGEECMVLASFGTKICSLIDKKLEEYVEENGPINWDDHIKVNDLRNQVKARRKRKSINNCFPVKNLTPDKKSSVAKVGKEYIPSFRSGGFALLLTLYKKSKERDFKGFMKKNELIEMSQDLCDASFTIPAEGSHYTAWSSMSNLIKKNYVERNGNPSRYSLTCAGELMASKLATSNILLTPPPSASSSEGRNLSHIIGVPDLNNKGSFHMHNISDSDETDNEISVIDDANEISVIDDDFCAEREPSPESSERISEICPDSSSASTENFLSLSFTYVTEDDVDTTSKTKAFVMVDEDRGSLLFLIKAKLIDLLSSDFDYHLEDKRNAPPGYTYAYFPDDIAPNVSTKLVENETKPLQPSRHRKSSSSSEDSKIEEYSDLLGRITQKSSKGLVIGDSKKRGSRMPVDDNEKASLEKAPLKISKRKLDKEKEVTAKVQKISNNIEISKSKKQIENDVINHFPKISTTSITKHSTSTTATDQCIKILPKISSEISVVSKQIPESDILFTLRPNSYKIILNIDNTEVYGGSSDGNKKSAKDIIKEDLQRNKIDFRVRNLNVGDFLWTCQGVDSSGQDRELVLPFVVERKRMDDLGQSIRDGRFKEQKFRLKQTGLQHLIYLVEEYGSNHTILPIPTCEQAITNTQIIDNFIIKVTKDQRESAAYLTIMTRYLQAKFKNKTLHCVSHESELLSRKTSASSSTMFLMNFNDLNSSSVKNRSLTIREMFAKHLLQINGASVDKVASIVQKYPTPRSIIEALESHSTSSREILLSGIRCQKSNRMIDQSVSSNIARIYTWENLL